MVSAQTGTRTDRDTHHPRILRPPPSTSSCRRGARSGSPDRPTPPLCKPQKKPLSGLSSQLAERVGYVRLILSRTLRAGRSGPAFGCPDLLPANLSNPVASSTRPSPPVTKKAPFGAFFATGGAQSQQRNRLGPILPCKQGKMQGTSAFFLLRDSSTAVYSGNFFAVASTQPIWNRESCRDQSGKIFRVATNAGCVRKEARSPSCAVARRLLDSFLACRVVSLSGENSGRWGKSVRDVLL